VKNNKRRFVRNPMSNWSISELLRSTQYGKVYFITKIGRLIHTRRVRRTKDSRFLVTSEKHTFVLDDTSQAKIGSFMFMEKDLPFAQVLNASDPVLIEEVNKVIKRLGGKS
jgi:hypothetical protein